jgi:hypothetical protein
MMKSPQQIYSEQLIPLVKGHPLWIPEPPSSLPPTHRELGIVPGDVGFLSPDGDFHYLFHVFSGPGGPRPEDPNPNPYGAPKNFVAIEVQEEDNSTPSIIKHQRLYTTGTCVPSKTNNCADISLTITDPTR